jgi:L-threonylcarbamoyladenylate synthase
MDANFFEQEVTNALHSLQQGGVILYPTDTVWGLGCNALNEEAIRKVYHIKNRDDSKSLIILVADEKDILRYVAAPDLQVFDFIQQQQKPTTIIFDNAIGLPDNLIAGDGSIAIRMVNDSFCRHLIKRLGAPLVSTSANISGQLTPQTFSAIDTAIKQQVDYVVQWRQDEESPAQPSQIIRWKNDGSYTIIRG